MDRSKPGTYPLPLDKGMDGSLPATYPLPSHTAAGMRLSSALVDDGANTAQISERPYQGPKTTSNMDFTAVANPKSPKRKHSLDSTFSLGPKRMRTLSDMTVATPISGSFRFVHHDPKAATASMRAPDTASDPPPSSANTDSVSCNRYISQANTAQMALHRAESGLAKALSNIREDSALLSYIIPTKQGRHAALTPSTSPGSPTDCEDSALLPASSSKKHSAFMDQLESTKDSLSPSPVLYIPTPGATPTSETTTNAPSDAIENLMTDPELSVDEMGVSLDPIDTMETDEPPVPTLTDEQFVKQTKQALKVQSKWKTVNVGRRQARRILELLEVSEPPNASEALIVTPEEARKQLESNVYFPGPIVTSNDQPLPVQTSTQFLNEFYDDTVKVSIQDPSVRLNRNVPHAREINIAQLKTRFLQPSTTINDSSPPTTHPWNCLEMATHVEDGLRPTFLSSEDSRLLTKLKHPSATDTASRRMYEPGWKEVEKWALLAQAGALTEPHQDSHGYSTYITLNQGLMGFGWLSNPTDKERLAWRDSPSTYTDGRWRHIVLRPGQTVYFPSGTVHYVFRLKTAGDTLAFGGHVLRCSQIVRWVQALLEEQASTDVTNENLTVSAEAYMNRVERFVKQAVRSGSEARWGGKEGVEEFLRLKGLFVQRAREMGYGK